MKRKASAVVQKTDARDGGSGLKAVGSAASDRKRSWSERAGGKVS